MEYTCAGASEKLYKIMKIEDILCKIISSAMNENAERVLKRLTVGVCAR
jgi:hypothetical protein